MKVLLCFGFGLWNAVTSLTVLCLLWLRLKSGWGNWMAPQKWMGSSAQLSSSTVCWSPDRAVKPINLLHLIQIFFSLHLHTHTHTHIDIQSNALPETGEICSLSLPGAGGTQWWLKCHDEQCVPAENVLMTLLHFSGLIVMSLNWSCW